MSSSLSLLLFAQILMTKLW